MATDTLSLDFGRDKPFYVYLYRDPRPKKKNVPIYVGKGTVAHGRADSHWLHGTHNSILVKMFALFRKAGIQPRIEIVAWFDDEDAALSLERALIKRFGRRDMDTGSLANMTDGGEGVSGWAPTAEYREKHRQITTERWRDAEYADKMKAMSQACWDDPDQRAMRLETIQRAISTPEYRENMSVAQKERWAKAIPEQVAAQCAFLNAPEARARARIKANEFLRSDEYREHKRAETVGKWSDPDFRATVAAGMRIAHARPDEKARKKDASTRAWADKKAAIVAGNKAAWADPVKRAARLAAIKAAWARRKDQLGCRQS